MTFGELKLYSFFCFVDKYGALGQSCSVFQKINEKHSDLNSTWVQDGQPDVKYGAIPFCSTCIFEDYQKIAEIYPYYKNIPIIRIVAKIKGSQEYEI